MRREGKGECEGEGEGVTCGGHDDIDAGVDARGKGGGIVAAGGTLWLG